MQFIINIRGCKMIGGCLARGAPEIVSVDIREARKLAPDIVWEISI